MKKSLFKVIVLSLIITNAQSMENFQNARKHLQRQKECVKKQEDQLASIPKEIRTILTYTIEKFDLVGELPAYKGQDFGISNVPGPYFFPITESLLYLNGLESPRVCDIGSGCGDISRLFTIKAKVDAIELIPEIVSHNKKDFKVWADKLLEAKIISKEKFKKMSASYNVQEGDILTLEVPENTYDLVGCLNLPHFLNPKQLDEIFFPKILKMLKPGGRVVLIAHTPQSNPEIVDYYFSQQKKEVPYPGYIQINESYFALSQGYIQFNPRHPQTLNETVSQVKCGHYDNEKELANLKTINVSRGVGEGYSMKAGEKIIVNFTECGYKKLSDSTDSDREKWVLKSNRICHYFTQGPLKEGAERAGLKVDKSYFMDTYGQPIDKLIQQDFYEDYFRELRVVVVATKPKK